MPEYLIQGTVNTTVSMMFRVTADDPMEALRQVHHQEVKPFMTSVEPFDPWSVSVKSGDVHEITHAI